MTWQEWLKTGRRNDIKFTEILDAWFIYNREQRAK